MVFSKWLKASKVYLDKRMMVMSCLGFSSGFPLLLVFGTLNLWLKDSGVSYALIGVFSLVKTPYSLKWAWSPIVDRVRLPAFCALGRRRGWAVFTQLMLFFGILGMASVDPAEDIYIMAALAVFVAFASASQDIVLDAYRIENFSDEEQGAGAATFVFGYRLGVLFSGAIALFLAEGLSWGTVYVIMSFGALIGITTILCVKEPVDEENIKLKKLRGDFRQRVSLFMSTAVIKPFADFMEKHNWKFILTFIFLYKMSDAYVGPMAYPFYDDMGFSKIEIASISKIYGVIATIAGSFIGGLIVSRMGLLRALLVCGIFQGISNLMFVGQAYAGHNIYMLMVTISVENISGGMATTAFVAYLSSLCNVMYTATQYALLSSLMSLARDMFAATSGFMVERVSWQMFFIVTTVMALPGLMMIVYMIKEEAAKLKKNSRRRKRKTS